MSLVDKLAKETVPKIQCSWIFHPLSSALSGLIIWPKCMRPENLLKSIASCRRAIWRCSFLQGIRFRVATDAPKT